MKLFKTFLFFLALAVSQSSFSQTGSIRGLITDADEGSALSLGYVNVKELNKRFAVDVNGIYLITNLSAGSYTLIFTYFGYDTSVQIAKVEDSKITKLNIQLNKKVRELGTVVLKGEARKIETTPDVGLVKITPREMANMPTIGGEPDILQYLQIIPGAVFTGDQGGQLYLRGGSPVMNKVMLDGMIIYNPFHSIGLFSVFDAEFMGSADVYTAGFGAEHGGRISAVVDVKTRGGSLRGVKKRLSISPFMTKFNIEGPLKKYKFGESNSSYMFSYKTSYLRQSAPVFYRYIDKNVLPYTFSDYYGKLSFNSPSGSFAKLFGFHFRDDVKFPGTTSYSWRSTGFGSRFLVIPDASKIKIEGLVSYSNYNILQQETDNKPRRSDVNAFDLGINFVNQLPTGIFTFGIETNWIQTNFEIFNSNDRRIEQQEFTTQLGTFGQYSLQTKRSSLEAGFRVQYYASLGDANLEPRLQYRYTVKQNKFYLKGAIGRYSQNLLSASSDRDVVNLFYGFLSGPDNLSRNFNGNPVTHSLQKANHFVAGFDYIINKFSDMGIEGYLKDFTQLTNINRDKLFDDNNAFANQPERLKQDYIIESGKAYGGDFKYRFSKDKIYIWTVYSLNYVDRFDGIQTYKPVFDRRHNINVIFSYRFGKKKNHTTGFRWNYGSGFPFTQTQGFYEKPDFVANGVSSDYISQNGNLGVLYGQINGGRLPQFHRLDFSQKWEFLTAAKYKTELILSVTNVYNRENIFYFDRINYKRINQLPILPSIAYNIKF